MGDIKTNIPENDLFNEVIDTDYIDADLLKSIGMTAMTARSEIPPSHRRVADSFVVVKKIYGLPVVQGRLTHSERLLLQKYDFNLLEFSTVKHINNQIGFLIAGSASLNRSLRSDCDSIIAVRAKELKFIMASKYASVTDELYRGYVVLERYFELISSHNQSPM